MQPAVAARRQRGETGEGCPNVACARPRPVSGSAEAVRGQGRGGGRREAGRVAPHTADLGRSSRQDRQTQRALLAAGGTPGPCGRTHSSQLLAGVTGQSKGDLRPPSEAAIRLEYRAGPRSSSCSRRRRRAVREARQAKSCGTSPARARDPCQAVQKQSGCGCGGADAGRRAGGTTYRRSRAVLFFAAPWEA